MPFDTIMELPDKVKAKLPSKEAKRIFMNAFNRAYDTTSGMESVSFAAAWLAIKAAGYIPDEDGEYVHMTSLNHRVGETEKVDMGAVHVNAAEDDLSVFKMDTYEKADYQGKDVELDRPFRTPDGPKKFAVYVKDGDKVKIVRFGDPDMEIRRDDEDARANFRARHSCDTATDKTTPRYWSCRMWSKKPVSDIAKNEGFTISAIINKIDDEKRLVYGWASIVEENGNPVTDHQGDIINPAELAKAAHEYMIQSRMAKVMHTGSKRGELVESLVLTKDVQKALGIDLGKVGWFVGFKINDDETWNRVKKGELKMFSIGGRGKREQIST